MGRQQTGGEPKLRLRQICEFSPEGLPPALARAIKVVHFPAGQGARPIPNRTRALRRTLVFRGPISQFLKYLFFVTSITIVSQKGGVGKTTLALNLAYSLARRGWNTLLVDTDPQGAIGLSLSRKTRGLKGMLDCLAGEADPADAILHTRDPNLHVLTAGKRGTLDIVEHAGEWYSATAIKRVFGRLGELGYEILLVDTPAGFFGPTLAMARESDYLLAPQQAEPLAIRSAPQLLETIHALQEQGLPANLLGLVLTMVQKDQEESAGVLREVRQSLPEEVVLEPYIPRDAIFLKASARGIPVALLQKNPPAAALVFDHVAAEIEKRAELGAKDYEPGQRVLLD